MAHAVVIGLLTACFGNKMSVTISEFQLWRLPQRLILSDTNNGYIFFFVLITARFIIILKTESSQHEPNSSSLSFVV